KEDPAGGNSNTSGAKVVAVPVTGFSSDGVQAGAWADRPSVDGGAATRPGVRAPDGTWTFDITPIVSRWSDGSLANNGVALISAKGAPDFEVVWTTSATAPTSNGQFVPPPAAGSDQSTPAGAATAAAASPSPLAASPAPQPVTLTPAPSPVALDAPSTPSPVSAPAASPSGTVAAAPPAPPPAAPSSVVASPRRAASPRTHAGTTGGFWIGVVAVLALAGLGMVALGALGEPVSGRRGSVLRALETRGLSSPSIAS
ncbi:MAG: hypothetical protein ACYDAD_13675, partial [Acidimicrobiales bacterium]